MWSILHTIYAVKSQATKWFNTSEGSGIEVELNLTKFCYSADVCTLDTAGAKQIGNSSILFNHVMIVIYEGALSNLLQLRRRNTRMFLFSFPTCQLLLFFFFLLSFTITEMTNYHYITNGRYLIQIKQVFYHNVVTKCR